MIPRVAVRLPLLALLLAASAQAASFDCAKARSRVEKLVCASPELGEFDERLAAAFKAIGPEPEGNEWGRWAPRVDDQRRWLREVRDRCRDTACLRGAYEERIAALQRWHDPAPVDANVTGRYVVGHEVAFVAGEGLEKESVSDCLSLLPRADGTYDLAIESIQTNGHLCSLTGQARVDESALQLVAGTADEYLDEGESTCAARVLVEQGELRVEAQAPSCSHFCGARAHLDGLVFPRRTQAPGPARACLGPEGDVDEADRP